MLKYLNKVNFQQQQKLLKTFYYNYIHNSNPVIRKKETDFRETNLKKKEVQLFTCRALSKALLHSLELLIIF